MERINLVELLRNCPSGMELDCTMYDDICFYEITDDPIFPIRIKRIDGALITLTKHGGYADSPSAKCVIFPKGKTTWEGFVPPCKFKDGDVLFHSDSASNGIFIFKKILQCGSIQKVICYCDYDSEDGFCLGENHTCCWTDSKILHPATKEQREILFQKMKEAGYKWNAETKTLEKLPKFKVGDRIRQKTDRWPSYRTIKSYDKNIGYFTTINDWVRIEDQDDWELLVPNKFDINTLVPFESRVLVRSECDNLWRPAIFGFYLDNNYAPYFAVGGTCWEQCIPYEGNEHLRGKIDNCDEFFRTWEKTGN